MLGSTFDGERLNALGMLQRLADNLKVPIHELLLADNGNGSSFDRARAEQAEREARDANLRAQQAEQAAREARRPNPAEPDPTPPKLPPDWRETFAAAEELNRSSFFLTGWESNFVTDLIARGTRFPSPKQAIVIVRILEKVAAFRPTASPHAEDWEDVE
jgi:hypothetical protein